MTLSELLIPAIIALLGSVITTIAARKLDVAKANKEDSSAFLVWAQEFRDAMGKSNIELEKTKVSLVLANNRIDELEFKMEEANKCNDSLQIELTRVKEEKSKLQDRVTVLEQENNALRIQIDELRKRKKRGSKNENSI